MRKKRIYHTKVFRQVRAEDLDHSDLHDLAEMRKEKASYTLGRLLDLAEANGWFIRPSRSPGWTPRLSRETNEQRAEHKAVDALHT